MSLLEREAALAQLATLAEEAQARAGRLVLISGEAGAGKSALVERFERDLPDASWFWGYCDGLSTPRPLGPVHDLASQMGGELERMRRREASREELFGAVLRRFRDADSLSVLVVEDVHWADQSTIDLVRYLARRLRDVPLLLIVTYRDDGLASTDPLRVALGDIARQGPTRRISLAPLSPEAVCVLAEGSGLDHRALHRLTAGNPFFVTEVIRAGMDAVPTSARDAVLARVAVLATESRAALEFAALIGARAEVGLVRHASGCDLSAIDELTGSGLLAGVGDQLAFRHEIARLAVLSSIPAHRLRPMHSAILDAMRVGGGGDETMLTFHAEAAGDHASVVHYARRTAQRAAKLGSHREAAAQYERALRFAAGMPQQLLAELLDGLAEELFLIDRWHDAELANRKAMALWHRLGDRLREGATSRRMAQTLWRQCRAAEGMSAARDAVAMLETMEPSRELARAYATLALGRMSIDPASSIELAGRAMTLAERLNVPEALADALGALGSIAIDTDGDWAGQLNRALRIAIAGGFEEQAARAFGNLHAAYSAKQRFADAEPYYVDGLAYCDAHGLTTFANWLVGDRTVALERQGRWAESAALASELLGQAGIAPMHRLAPLTSLGALAARQASDNPWTFLDDALTVAEANTEPNFIVVVRNARAEARWLAADIDAARHEAQAAAAHVDGSNAWDRGATAAWLHRTSSRVTIDGPLAEPYQLLAQGEWEQAAQAWAVLGCPYEQALSLVDGDQEQSLRTALDLLAGLGAKAAIRLTRHRLRTKGVRSVPYGPHTATRAHPSGLTSREIEVLALMSRGNTNAEIATRLFISTKTVDHHVSSILAKLQVSTRRAAVAKATQLGWSSVSG